MIQSQILAPVPTSDSAQNGCEFPVASSTTLSVRSKSPENNEKYTAPPRDGAPKRTKRYLKLKEDYRARLPLNVSRFLGYRSQPPPYEPLAIFPFTLLDRISLKHEEWVFAFLGSLGSILLIEAIMSTHTAFHDVYQSPLIISSFGASAVLVFGVIESPLAQPRNLVLGHLVSSLVSVAMTRLWVRNGSYDVSRENTSFYAPSFVNGGLCMSVSLLAQLVLGIVHPPGGATGLAAATEEDVVLLSWHYIPVLVASSTIMLGWAMIINNLGRRRYPVYWWSSETSQIRNTPDDSEEQKLGKLEEGMLREAEDRGQGPDALYMERIHAENIPGEVPAARRFSRESG